VNAEATHPPVSVLLIDDEPQMQRLLRLMLETNGYRVTSAPNGREGLASAARHRHDLIILDLGLPDLNGIEVLKQLREWTQTPVVILTVITDEANKIEALDRGADDYVTKPFNAGELLARLRATLRRVNRSAREEPVFQVGGLTVDFNSRRIMRNGELVKLTATEFALLRLFVQHAGKVLTHRHILQEIWGPAHSQRTQYLRVYMTRLREKLESNPAEPVMFLTEQGVGYRFVEE
jgi:two-component system, OmpR family, KDP operon response regulator KdpE